jgi:hypothetical protein
MWHTYADYHYHTRCIAPARGPLLWEMLDAGKDRFDPQAQPAPDFEFDQRFASAIFGPHAVIGARCRPFVRNARHEIVD